MSPADFMRQYEAATAAHDLVATLGLIAPDAVYLFSDQSSHFGKDAIRQVLQRNFDSIKAETYQVRGLQWLVESDEVAACVFEFQWSGTIKGQSASGHGRGTSIIRRSGGDWRVVHEHLSAGRLERG